MADDDFDNVVDNVKRGSTWMRIVFMVGFCVVLYVVSVVVWFLTAAQALFSIFTGSDNRNLRSLGSSLAEYVNQILRFITYNSELKPFPFGPFPDPVESDSEVDEDLTGEEGGVAQDSAEAHNASGPETAATSQPGGQFDDLAFLSRPEETEEEMTAEETIPEEEEKGVQQPAIGVPKEGETKIVEETLTEEDASGEEDIEGMLEAVLEEKIDEQEQEQDAGEAGDDSDKESGSGDIEVRKYTRGKDTKNIFSSLNSDKQDNEDSN